MLTEQFFMNGSPNIYLKMLGRCEVRICIVIDETSCTAANDGTNMWRKSNGTDLCICFNSVAQQWGDCSAKYFTMRTTHTRHHKHTVKQSSVLTILLYSVLSGTALHSSGHFCHYIYPICGDTTWIISGWTRSGRGPHKTG